MMPNRAQEDFKKDGPFSEIFRRLAMLEKEMRELRTVTAGSIAVQSYVPVITGLGGGTAPTYTGTCLGNYVVVGGVAVLLTVDLVNNAGGIAGAGVFPILISSPTAINASLMGIGSGLVYENGGTLAGCFVRAGDVNNFTLYDSVLNSIYCQDQSSVARYIKFTTIYFL